MILVGIRKKHNNWKKTLIFAIDFWTSPGIPGHFWGFASSTLPRKTILLMLLDGRENPDFFKRRKKKGQKILSSRWHLRHGCQFWESPHSSPFRRESRSLVLKKLAIEKNSPFCIVLLCFFSFCFSNIPGGKFTKRSLFDSLLKKKSLVGESLFL